MIASRMSRCSKLRVIRRFYSDTSEPPNKRPPQEHPALRTFRILTNDVKAMTQTVTGIPMQYENFGTKNTSYHTVTNHCDVVIIGGGIMGSSIAYWLREKVGDGLRTIVIEKDPTYKEASTVLSVGGLRQQFSLPENIQMSQYGAEFFRKSKLLLGEDVDLQFTPYGYLLLATEKTASQLEANYNIQQTYNVKNQLLSKSALKAKFPWLNTDDIVLGCHGLENEGWFDPWSLLNGFKRKAIQLGTEYITGEVVDFGFVRERDFVVSGVEPGSFEKLNSVMFKKNDEIHELKFSIAIIAAGPSSGKIAKLARIGTRDGLRSFPLPIEPRKRYVYCFSCKDGNLPSINTPMTFDPSGTYFRREGYSNNFIAGRAPSPDKEPEVDNLDVDESFFETDVWPHLAERVPAFQGVKLNSSWAGFYEFNTFDENGIIGTHPYHGNLLIASGFSGHGIQQAPAVGRAISELLIDGEFKTIDLTRLGFDRIITDRPMFENSHFSNDYHHAQNIATSY